MKKIFPLILLIGLNTANSQPVEQSSSVVSCPSLTYPKEAQVRQEEGSVELRFKIKSDATVGEILIHRSSGFPALDESAIDYIRSCRLKPKIIDSIAVDSFAAKKVTFKLTDHNKAQDNKDRLRVANLERMTRLAASSNIPPKLEVPYLPTNEYPERLARRIKPYIAFGKVLDSNPQAVVEIRAASDGSIIEVSLVSSSGDNDWDQAVLKAVIRAKSLPFDSNGKVPEKLVINFRPND